MTERRLEDIMGQSVGSVREPHPNAQACDRPLLLYITGAPHSGSTILEAILTGGGGARGLGQFGRFYAFTQFDECSCGEPSASCDTCVFVRETVLEPFGAKRYERIGQLTRREWSLPLMAVSRRLRSIYREPSELALKAVSEHSNSNVLLDSSKSISRGLAVLESDHFDVVVIHTIRDFAGFISSREKRTNSSGKVRDVARLWKWLFKNALIVRLIQPRADRFYTVRFEDLAADPEAEITKLCNELGLESETPVSLLGSGESLHRTHLFEPPRQFDYRGVVFDPNRRKTSSLVADDRRKWLWKLGGRFGKRWGYGPVGITDLEASKG